MDNITFQKGLKIKDYQNMINDRDNNIRKLKLEHTIKNLKKEDKHQLGYAIVCSLILGCVLGYLLGVL